MKLLWLKVRKHFWKFLIVGGSIMTLFLLFLKLTKPTSSIVDILDSIIIKFEKRVERLEAKQKEVVKQYEKNKDEIELRHEEEKKKYKELELDPVAASRIKKKIKFQKKLLEELDNNDKKI